MISSIVSRLVILLFGTLYPAYASYKAVRTKDVREYVKWMMYWIVFALFTCAETFTDVLLSFWFPFYYEIKIVVVVWLLSPATKGSSILYRKFVHPTLKNREQEIDEAINNAKAQGYSTIRKLGAKGVDYAKYVIMQTAIRGGGGLMNQLRKSYSLSDLADHHEEMKYKTKGLGSLEEEQDHVDDVAGMQYMRRSYMHPGYRSGSAPNPLEMYFSEINLDMKQREKAERQALLPDLPLSMDDISSGYSSADPLCSGSLGNSPTSDHALEDILLNSSSIGSNHPKFRKLSGNSLSKKSAEGLASLVDGHDLSTLLDQRLPSASIRPYSMLLELRNSLSSKEGDFAKTLASLSQHDCEPICIRDKIAQGSSKSSLSQEKPEDSRKISSLEGNCNQKVQDFETDVSGIILHNSSEIFDVSAVDQESRSPPGSTVDVLISNNVSEQKEMTGRAGRYRKLRAPGPPNKSTSDAENAGVCNSSSPPEDNKKTSDSVKTAL